MTFDEFKTDFDATIGKMSEEELEKALVAAGVNLEPPSSPRTVKLRPWQCTKHYKDRHPQGVIAYPSGYPERWGIIRSHKVIEAAIASAATYNERQTTILGETYIFEAVYFQTP